MLKFYLFLFFFIFKLNANADNKIKIVENLKKTKNLSFNFEQNTNGKVENGNCIIEYLKDNNKILVSNGKSLIIKTKTSFYRYTLGKTPLNLILDKEFLIKKIHDLNEEIIDKSYINYKIVENDHEINVFFDNKTFNLIGWQTRDIYQNLNMTLLSLIEINQKISKDLFKLPSQN
jgi:outer membrane lipoprotein-sorting protein